MNKMELTLCSVCRENFREAGYIVRQRKSDEIEKSECCFCSCRQGYEYEVFAKEKPKRAAAHEKSA